MVGEKKKMINVASPKIAHLYANPISLATHISICYRPLGIILKIYTKGRYPEKMVPLITSQADLLALRMRVAS